MYYRGASHRSCLVLLEFTSADGILGGIPNGIIIKNFYTKRRKKCTSRMDFATDSIKNTIHRIRWGDSRGLTFGEPIFWGKRIFCFDARQEWNDDSGLFWPSGKDGSTGRAGK